MNVIDINEATKVFGSRKKTVRAVHRLSLQVLSGQVFGFLGPNGAGKSTTIRMILDLVRPTRGSVSLFGQEVRQNPGVLGRVGALVEGATFYPFLSGRENLKVLALTGQRVDKARLDALLTQVGLGKRADQKVSQYSSGMKQRLGIAAALLSDPDLVILDEPTNGLDPAGILEIRRFIRALAAEQGKTVFLSSHQLNEVEQVCDRVAIINKGELVREGSVAALLSETVTELRLQVSLPERAFAMLKDDWQTDYMNSPGWIRAQINPALSASVVRFLVENGVEVRQAVLDKQSLEDYFMSVTGREQGRD
jgi:ABC-2 type transport system ATP-binding protein